MFQGPPPTSFTLQYPPTPMYPPPPYSQPQPSQFYPPQAYNYSPPYPNNPPPPPPQPHVINDAVSRRRHRFAIDTPFRDVFGRICEIMGVDPEVAQLGFKLSGDPARQPPTAYETEDDHRTPVSSVTDKNARARKKYYLLEIFNLRQPAHCNAARRSLAGKKRKGDELDGVDTKLNFAPCLRTLREDTRCEKHPTRFCWVDPRTGKHWEVDIYGQTIWAKDIFLGKATYNRPPNSSHFDGFRKRTRRARSRSRSREWQAPAVHVHLNGVQLADGVSGSTQTPVASTSSPVPGPSSTISAPSSPSLITPLHLSPSPPSRSHSVTVCGFPPATTQANPFRSPRPPFGDRTILVTYPRVHQFLSELSLCYPHAGFTGARAAFEIRGIIRINESLIFHQRSSPSSLD
ncbi:hypothetical protein PQX77_021343 [Marasmius sp. AFHP31]|nr:hypothetical protein PQX77_021343 [Marasmius sp. AFHP31]